MEASSTPQIFTTARQTGVKDYDIETKLKPDLGCIAGGLTDVLGDQCPWNIVHSHELYPAWEEEDEPHDESVIRETVRRAVIHSDAMICHGFDDGSASIGLQYSCFRPSLYRRPVLVVHHEKDQLSKNMVGEIGSARGVDLVPFASGADLICIVTEWLQDNRVAIEEGAQARQVLWHAWAPTARQLQDGWSRLSPDEQESAADTFGLDPVELGNRLGEPLETAILPGHILLTLTERLCEQRTIQAAVDAVADEFLRPEEALAFRRWAEQRPLRFALLILDEALDARRHPTRITREVVGSLDHPALWTNFADAYISETR